ncbi:hypothetical protein C0J52_03450 [Blattella germanica]|nr:hypothetical protein C0J52_03450 [Blattella germanica]
MSHKDSHIAVKHLTSIFKKDWKRLGDGFSLQVQSPPSSPPEIRWSSSGSSDGDKTIAIRKPQSHHRIITRLNFDSCVSQSPINVQKCSAHITRNVVNLGQIDISKNHHKTHCHLDDSKRNKYSVDVTDVKNPLCDSELAVINENDNKNDLENTLSENKESQNIENVPNSNYDITDENTNKKSNLTCPIETAVKKIENRHLLPDACNINSVCSENPNINPDVNDIYSVPVNLKNADLCADFQQINSAYTENTDINSFNSLVDDSVVSPQTESKSPSLLPSKNNLYRNKLHRRKKRKHFTPQKEKSLSPVLGSYRNRSMFNKHSILDSEIRSLESSKLKPDNNNELILNSEGDVTQNISKSPVWKLNSCLNGLKSKEEEGRNYLDSEMQISQSRIVKLNSREIELDILGISKCKTDSEFCHMGMETDADENTSSSPILRRMNNSYTKRFSLKKEIKNKLGSPILNITLHKTNTQGDSVNASLRESAYFQNDIKSSAVKLTKEYTDLNYLPDVESSKSINTDTVVTECVEENVIVQELISSPIFGTEGKSTKWKRKKVTKKSKDFNPKENAVLDVNLRLTKVCKNLFSDEPIENLDQSTKVSLDEVYDEIKAVDAEESHIEETIVDVSRQNNVIKVDYENYTNMDADLSSKENDETEVVISSSLDSNTDILIVESQKEQVASSCNYKEEGSDIVNSQPLIETVSSQEIEIQQQILTSQENCSGRVSGVSSPISSSGNSELNSISSCSTPQSQRIVRKSDPEEKSGGTELYLDSAKKKRMRLSRTGLAARLKKLISRNESTKNMWKHEMSQSKPSRSVNKSIVLTILLVKRDCSRTLLYCTSSSGKNSLYKYVVNLPRLNTTIILGVSCFEEVHDTEKYEKNVDMLFKPEQKVTETVYAGSCSCLKGDTKKCQYQFERGGLEFLEYLLPTNFLKGIPKNVEDNKNGNMQIESSKKPARDSGTIAEAVTNLGSLLTGDIWLQLYVLQVFCYNSRNHLNNSMSNNQEEQSTSSISWSILGCDKAGECCELVLGPSSVEASMSTSWTEITTKQAIGHFFRFTAHEQNTEEITEHQDLLKENLPSNPNSSEVLNSEPLNYQSLKKIGTCQLFIYVFAPGTESWEMEVMEQSHSESTSERHTYLVKLICTMDDHLYVSDHSLKQGITNGYMKVAVKNSCFVPPEVRSQKTSVLLLQDIVYDKGILNVDKYSWLIPLGNRDNKDKRSWCPQLNNEDLDLLDNLQIKLPYFMMSSMVKDLVMVTGTVSNVDEETAFSWPVCEVCENELLIELSDGKYLCQDCNSSQTSIRMSLEVYVECKQIPEFCKVKVKLQQASIMKLLPISPSNSEGYELSSVLGQDVGPLSCIVTRASTNSFFLREASKTLVFVKYYWYFQTPVNYFKLPFLVQQKKKSYMCHGRCFFFF